MIINQPVLKFLALGIIATPILLIATGRSSHLNCDKLEQDYVMCQLEQRYIHSFLSNSTGPFRLIKVDIESELHYDEDGDYYTYKTHVYSSGKKHLFHDYGQFKVLAQLDQEKVNQLINGPVKSSIQLTRSYLFGDLLIVLALVIIGSSFIK